jgi:hypothetical protein
VTKRCAANAFGVTATAAKMTMSGAGIADDLNYVSVPAAVVNEIENSWSEILKGPDGKSIWTPRH